MSRKIYVERTKNYKTTRTVLCENIEVANNLFSQARGRMFTRSMPYELGLVFPLGEAQPVPVHMLFVPYSLGVIWVKDDIVVRTEILKPFTGYARQEADMLIEVHPNKMDSVRVGDTIEIDGSL